jgi:hypothetical protein
MTSALSRALLGAAALFAPACVNDRALDIVRVSELGPRHAEIGDRIEITGQHFPQSAELKRVRLTLRGTLARAGLPPCPAPVEVTLSDPPDGASEYDPVSRSFREATYARSTQRTLRLDGPDRLALLLSDSLFEQLTRCPSEPAGAPVSHGTLSFGDAHARYARLGVTVRFEGLTGTHAIEGTLRGATLDLLAPPSRRVLHVQPLRHDAARVLSALGLTLADAHPTTGGLRIASVLHGSPADRAGIGANDVLTTIDGLSVLALEDLALPLNTRATRLGVSRDDLVDERVVVLERYATASPSDLLSSAIALLVASIALGFALRPGPGALASVGRLAQHALDRGDRRAFGPWLRAQWSAALDRSAPVSMTARLAVAAPLTLLALAPFVPSLLRLGWDVGLLYALGAGLRLLSGPSASWRTVLAALPTSVAALLALGTSVVASGTFRAEGIVGAQGGAPWSWHALRSPVAVAQAALFLIALVVGAPAEPARPAPEPSRRERLVALAGWAGTLLVSAAGVTALFGGWQVPGSDLARQETSAALQMLGGALFLAKSWALTLGTAWLRATIPASRTAALVHRAGRWILGVSALAALVQCVLALLVPRLPAFVGVALSHGTFSLAGLVLVASALRPRAMSALGLHGHEPTAFSSASDSNLR